MKRASLVGLSVLAVLLMVMVLYLTGHHALSGPGRTVYRVNRLTGEVTTVRTHGPVVGPSPASERMAPQHVLPSAAEQIR
jgi:hypothetical protein